MWRWLKSKLGGSHAAAVAAQHAELIALYDAQLLNELNRLEPHLRSAFKRLDEAALPQEVERLHVEVFLDEPGFGFRLFAYDADWIEITPAPMVDIFNETAQAQWPLFKDLDLAQFEVRDRKGALAAHQPLDDYSPNERLWDWFADMTQRLKLRDTHEITLAFHDLTRPEPL